MRTRMFEQHSVFDHPTMIHAKCRQAIASTNFSKFVSVLVSKLLDTGIRPRRIMKMRAVSVALGASALFSADAFMATPAALRSTLRAATRPVSFNGEPLLRHSSASLCLCGAVDRCVER